MGNQVTIYLKGCKKALYPPKSRQYQRIAVEAFSQTFKTNCMQLADGNNYTRQKLYPCLMPGKMNP